MYSISESAEQKQLTIASRGATANDKIYNLGEPFLGRSLPCDVVYIAHSDGRAFLTEMELLLVGLFIGIICGSFANHISILKGWDGASWFLLGLLFGPFALLAACGLPDRRTHRYLRAIGENMGADLSAVELNQAEPFLAENEFVCDEAMNKDELWRELMEKLEDERVSQASFDDSWFYRRLITARTKEGRQIARATAIPMAFGKVKWRVEKL